MERMMEEGTAELGSDYIDLIDHEEDQGQGKGEPMFRDAGNSLVLNNEVSER